MLKKPVSLLVLLCFSCLAFALEPTSAVQPIREIISELKAEQQKSEALIQSLETNNEQMRNDLSKVQTLLNESLTSQKRQTAMLENFGNLIDEQAIYTRSLNRKLIFWRTTSLTLSVSLLATAGTVLVIAQPWK